MRWDDVQCENSRGLCVSVCACSRVHGLGMCVAVTGPHQCHSDPQHYPQWGSLTGLELANSAELAVREPQGSVSRLPQCWHPRYAPSHPSSLFKICFILCVVFYLHVCMCTVSFQCLAGGGASGNGVTGGCKPPGERGGPNQIVCLQK